jgi:hypothetical protein
MRAYAGYKKITGTRRAIRHSVMTALTHIRSATDSSSLI